MAADILGEHFTQISNAAIRDPRLSFKARGVLAWLASHQDGYGCSVAAIVADSDSDGKAAIRTALDELEGAGYLVRERVRDPGTGRLGPADYLVTDCPMSENLIQALTSGNAEFSQVTPNVRFPGAGKSDTKNTRPKNTSKNTSADFSTSSSPKETRESADDGELSDDEQRAIALAVIGVRPEWHTPGIMAQIKQVAHLPADVVMPAFVEAAGNRTLYHPMHLASRALEIAHAAEARKRADGSREQSAEEWRREVHDDVENRARPESRAEHLARLKAEAQAGSLRSPVRGASRAG